MNDKNHDSTGTSAINIGGSGEKVPVTDRKKVNLSKPWMIGIASVLVLSLSGAGFWALTHDDETEPLKQVSVAPERSWNEEGDSQEFLPEARVIEGQGESMMTMPDNEQGGTPVSFEIIGIDAVGSQDSATLAPPERIDQVGHYVRSPQAGEDNPVGSALYTSHVNYAGQVGVGSVWTSLVDGDPITFTDEEGKESRYVVDGNPFRIDKSDPDYVQKTSDTINDMTSTDGRVVLVSCGGEFVGGALGYEDNVFVIARPLETFDE